MKRPIRKAILMVFTLLLIVGLMHFATDLSAQAVGTFADPRFPVNTNGWTWRLATYYGGHNNGSYSHVDITSPGNSYTGCVVRAVEDGQVSSVYADNGQVRIYHTKPLLTKVGYYFVT